MKLEQLRQFVELERYGSVSKAAKALYIGRTTLSDSLAAFEKEVGVRLLERTAAGVTLTKEGREVLQVAKQVLEMTDKILQVGNQEQRICGKITVVLGQVFNFLGSDIIVQFHQRFPDAELELLVKTHTELLQDVFVRGNIGLTIFPKKEMELYNRKIEQQKLHADIFGEYHFDVFVSAQSQYARKNSITAEELYANQIAANSSDFKDRLLQCMQPQKNILLVNDHEILKKLIASNEVVAILPETYMLGDYYEKHKLIKRIPMPKDFEMTVVYGCILYPQEDRMTVLEKCTVDLLKELLPR